MYNYVYRRYRGIGSIGSGRSGSDGTEEDEMKEAYCTTGSFSKLGKGFDKHCGPTAVTNLILTLQEEREDLSQGIRSMRALQERVFLQVARFGMKSRIYWNTNFLGVFGGTSDFLAPILILTGMREFGLKGYVLRGPFVLTEKRMLRELEKGAVLYLMLHRNSQYESHHLLCYGAEERDGITVFRLADGWVGKARYLSAKELRYGLFYSIRPKKKEAEEQAAFSAADTPE